MLQIAALTLCNADGALHQDDFGAHTHCYKRWNETRNTVCIKKVEISGFMC